MVTWEGEKEFSEEGWGTPFLTNEPNLGMWKI